MKKVTAKSWTYFKRAHLHANGLSASSLAMILLLAALPVNRRLKAVNAAVLGIGSLGYAMFWMFAGLRAPAMGSTGNAKESLQWLAIPVSWLCILGLVVVVALAVRCLFLARPTAS
jgi:predicted acyltransferase